MYYDQGGLPSGDRPTGVYGAANRPPTQRPATTPSPVYSTGSLAQRNRYRSKPTMGVNGLIPPTGGPQIGGRRPPMIPGIPGMQQSAYSGQQQPTGQMFLGSYGTGGGQVMLPWMQQQPAYGGNLIGGMYENPSYNYEQSQRPGFHRTYS